MTLNPHPRPECKPGCFGCKAASVILRNRTAFQPHFNYAVGQHVNTEREFKSLLRRRADENSIATGMDHNYEMRDPGEMRESTPFPDHDDIINAQGKGIAEKYAST